MAQGLLTDKYLDYIPGDSRVAKPSGFLKKEQLTPEKINQVRQLNELAQKRGQTLAQMALSWLLKDERVTSVLVGASKPQQLIDSLKCLDNMTFSGDELFEIDAILGHSSIQ